MKKAMTTQEMIDVYLETGAVQSVTLVNGDYKRGNKAAIRNQKVFEILKKDNSIATSVLKKVMDSKIDKARSNAAADALRLGILTEQAVAVLEEVAKRNDIIGFGAKMSLKIWRGEVPGKTL